MSERRKHWVGAERSEHAYPAPYCHACQTERAQAAEDALKAEVERREEAERQRDALSADVWQYVEQAMGKEEAAKVSELFCQTSPDRWFLAFVAARAAPVARCGDSQYDEHHWMPDLEGDGEWCRHCTATRAQAGFDDPARAAPVEEQPYQSVRRRLRVQMEREPTEDELRRVVAIDAPPEPVPVEEEK